MRARTHNPLSALAFSLGLLSLSAAAQPEEREVVLTGAPEDPPAVVYAVANLPLVLVFDQPLRSESAVLVPGADVRSHSFLAHALVLTPSNALADQGAAALSVPLANGMVALKLAFTPGRSDRLVRVVRRAPAARADPVRGELEKVLHATVEAMLAADAHQRVATDGTALLRVVGEFKYLEVMSNNTSCVPTSARLLGGPEPLDAVFLHPMTSCAVRRPCSVMLVVRTPAVEVESYRVELLAQDGALCSRRPDIEVKPKARE